MPATTLPIEIVPFTERYAGAFKQLNLAWLEGYDLLEPADLVYLDAPQEKILAHGGQIFVALSGETPVGTCAILPHAAGEYELLKLAVSPAVQGQGIGRRLAAVAIQFARTAGARKIILVSSHKLVSAVRLYETLGFRHAPLPPDVEYATADVYMELACSSDA